MSNWFIAFRLFNAPPKYGGWFVVRPDKFDADHGLYKNRKPPSWMWYGYHPFGWLPIGEP